MPDNKALISTPKLVSKSKTVCTILKYMDSLNLNVLSINCGFETSHSRYQLQTSELLIYTKETRRTCNAVKIP